MATRALTRRRSAGRAERVRRRLAAAPAPARASGAVMLAFTGLLLPGLLLLHSGRLPAQPAAHTTQVVRKVVVRKVVHERTVVVREAAPPARAGAVRGQPAAPVTAQAAAPKAAGEEDGDDEAGAVAKTRKDHDRATAPRRPCRSGRLPNPAEPAAPAEPPRLAFRPVAPPPAPAAPPAPRPRSRARTPRDDEGQSGSRRPGRDRASKPCAVRVWVRSVAMAPSAARPSAPEM